MERRDKNVLRYWSDSSKLVLKKFLRTNVERIIMNDILFHPENETDASFSGSFQRCLRIQRFDLSD